MSEWRETFWDGQVHMNVQINIFYIFFSSPVFEILAVFMLEISINNCSRQLYLVFSLSTNRCYFLPDHVISNCVTRSSSSRLYAIKRLVGFYTISPSSLCRSLSASSIECHFQLDWLLGPFKPLTFRSSIAKVHSKEWNELFNPNCTGGGGGGGALGCPPWQILPRTLNCCTFSRAASWLFSLKSYGLFDTRFAKIRLRVT